MGGVRHAIEQFAGCSDAEKRALATELAELESIRKKLEEGRVEIVLFGEIDTGKSALINALVGQAVAEVDVRGGWTKEVWRASWSGCGYCVPGLERFAGRAGRHARHQRGRRRRSGPRWRTTRPAGPT